MVSLFGRVAVTCVSVVLTGCSPPATKETTSVPRPPSAAPTRQVELTRLGEIENAFPPGYLPHPLIGPRVLDAQRRESVGDFVSYGRPLAVAPHSCRALLEPVDATVATEEVGMATGTSPQDPFVAVSADDPVSVPVAIPASGCDRFTFSIDGGGVPDGAVQRLPAPGVDDAVTFAVKVVFTAGGNPIDGALVEYFYTAILDGRTLVKLWARVPSDFVAEPTLPDLLTKAVTAVRGG